MDIVSQIKEAVRGLLLQGNLNESVANDFLERIKYKKLSIDDNPVSHFCAYFAPYNKITKKVFLGHHKKSGLWLFNGGHVDKGESLRQSLKREINEEWGLNADDFEIKELAMLTITDIYNPEKQPCRKHFDLWNFLDVSEKEFNPDKEKLEEEFYEAGWKDLNEARGLMGHNNKQTLEAINFVEDKYFK